MCHVCLACSVEDEHHFIFDCPAYSHIRDQHDNLFQNPNPIDATDQPGVLGYYLQTCFSHRQSVLTSPPHHSAVLLQGLDPEVSYQRDSKAGNSFCLAIGLF